MSKGYDINQHLTRAGRRALVRFMFRYLTDEVVAVHQNLRHFGAFLFTDHRDYLAGMERFFEDQGVPEFVPLPVWNPARPIPQELDRVRRTDSGAPRSPEWANRLQNRRPDLPLPRAFTPSRICGFRDATTLGNALGNNWHNRVHNVVGGAMATMEHAPAAPVFWCFHAFIDGIYRDWLDCRGTESD
ncbi:MAG: tyrosinase family protein [Oleiphilaceae bacterium]|nr:tyrosinase family protein [Oleiphilaceae bacterium]